MNSDMTFKIDFGPMLDFFRKLPADTQGFVAGLEFWHYYLALTWLFGLFVVPPKLKSLGSLALAPVWMPFFVVARTINFVLAAKRGSSVVAMTESVSRATTNLESTAGKLKDAQEDLEDYVSDLKEGLKEFSTNSLRELREQISGLQKEFADSIIELNSAIEDGGSDLYEIGEKLTLLSEDVSNMDDSLLDLTSILNEKKDTVSETEVNNLNAEISKLKQQIVVLNASLEEYKKQLFTSNQTVTALRNDLAVKNNELLVKNNELSVLRVDLANAKKVVTPAKSLLEKVLAEAYADKADNWYVPVGVVNQNGSQVGFTFKLAIRLGAIRNGTITENDICKIPVATNDTVVNVLPNGLPTLEKKPVATVATPVPAKVEEKKAEPAKVVLPYGAGVLSSTVPATSSSTSTASSLSAMGIPVVKAPEVKAVVTPTVAQTTTPVVASTPTKVEEKKVESAQELKVKEYKAFIESLRKVLA